MFANDPYDYQRNTRGPGASSGIGVAIVLLVAGVAFFMLYQQKNRSQSGGWKSEGILSGLVPSMNGTQEKFSTPNGSIVTKAPALFQPGEKQSRWGNGVAPPPDYAPVRVPAVSSATTSPPATRVAAHEMASSGPPSLLWQPSPHSQKPISNPTPVV